MSISKKDLAYFEAAKAVSRLSDYSRAHIGCIVVYGHRIISSGYNQAKGNPLQKKYNKERFTEDTGHGIHAEIAALRPILGKDIDWKRCKLYIYREYKDGQKSMCRPCKSCEKLIRDLGIKKIFYTGSNSYIKENFI